MTKPRFKLAACAAQHIGDRLEQQDRVGIFTSKRLPGAALFVVADGMGGKTGGAMAAQQVMSTAKHLFEEFSPVNETIEELLRQIAQEAHTIIKLSALSSEKEPHSTMTAMVLQQERADWAHVGDSRLYRFRGADLLERTIDHSYVEQLVAEGKLDPEQAHSHRLSNLLTNALGTARAPEVTLHGTESLEPGDIFLLCSDGLWHYFSELELGVILSTAAPRAASERLIQIARERANAQGDNCSMVIVRLDPPDPEPVRFGRGQGQGRGET